LLSGHQNNNHLLQTDLEKYVFPVNKVKN
jgi:hypothetical protein